MFEALPFMNKNLFEILIEREFHPFDVSFSFSVDNQMDMLRKLLRQMLSSLGRMHNCNIIHTDIKPGLLYSLEATCRECYVLPSRGPE